MSHIGIGMEPDDHDWHLDATGNLVMVEDSEAVAQHAKQRVLFWEGEWFLDRDAGLPWLTQVFITPPNLPLSESAIKIEITNTPDVVELTDFYMEFDRTNRGLKVFYAKAKTTYDEIIDLTI